MQTSIAVAETAERNGKNARNGAATIMISSAIINFLLAGPLQQIFDVIKSSQILTHLLLINVPTPASASIFF